MQLAVTRRAPCFDASMNTFCADHARSRHSRSSDSRASSPAVSHQQAESRAPCSSQSSECRPHRSTEPPVRVPSCLARSLVCTVRALTIVPARRTQFQPSTLHLVQKRRQRRALASPGTGSLPAAAPTARSHRSARPQSGSPLGIADRERLQQRRSCPTLLNASCAVSPAGKSPARIKYSDSEAYKERPRGSAGSAADARRGNNRNHCFLCMIENPLTDEMLPTRPILAALTGFVTS